MWSEGGVPWCRGGRPLPRQRLLILNCNYNLLLSLPPSSPDAILSITVMFECFEYRLEIRFSCEIRLLRNFCSYWLVVFIGIKVLVDFLLILSRFQVHLSPFQMRPTKNCYLLIKLKYWKNMYLWGFVVWGLRSCESLVSLKHPETTIIINLI